MLKTSYRKLLDGESGSVFRGMLTLMMGAGLARIIGLISIPILTRLYAPEDYGVLALYTSLVSVLAPALTLRYVQALPFPNTDVMAFNLLSLSFKLMLVALVAMALLLFLFGETILGWFNMQALVPWWWLIVIGAGGKACYEIFTLWATRKKQYKIIAKTQFTQSLIGNLVKVGLGFLAIKPGGLILGQFLSESAGITSFIRSSYIDFKEHIKNVSYQREVLVARYYQDFAWFRLPSHLMMALSLQAPVFLVSMFYD